MTGPGRGAPVWKNPLFTRAGIVLLIALLFFSGIGDVPFFDRDEGEYATVAREMIERSDYVVPHVNGRPYYEKPALFFWMMVVSFKLLGYNETAGRLPSALAGAALVLLLAWFGRRRAGDKGGQLAALFAGTSFLFVLLARVALLDTLLTLWTSATLVFFYEGYTAQKGEDGPFFLAAWVCLGLAFLTKGPVGVVIPLFSVFVLTLWNRDLWRTIGRSRPLLGLLLFAVTAGPWYGLILAREGRRFYEGFFIGQNVNRFSDALLGHGAPLWYYLPVLAVMLWPWSVFAVPQGWRALTARAGKGNKPDALAAVDRFLTVWLLSSLLVFSLTATKQPNYIMPAAPAVILLAARWWRDRLAEESAKGVGPVLAGCSAALGLILGAALLAVPLVIPPALERARAGIRYDSFEYAFPAQAPQLGPGTYLLGALLAVCAVSILLAAVFANKKTVLMFLILGAVIFSAGPLHVTAPPLLDYLQTPARDLARSVGRAMAPGDRLAAYGLYKPTLWYYTGRRIERIRFEKTGALRKYLSRDGRVFLISRLSLLPRLKAEGRFRFLEQRGGYIWGDNQGLAAREGGGAP